jgi:iron(III) transport system substrate-binding protein
MNSKFSHLGVFLFLVAATSITRGIVFSASAATLDDTLKNLRSLAPQQRKTFLEENARKEGELVWYTSMSLTDFPKIVSAFEKAVPFVKVRANRLSQSTVITKIDTEARAGLFAVDIVGSAPVEICGS